MLTQLAASARHASMWGRTNYGRALHHSRSTPTRSVPKTSLLVLGDARSNYTDPALRHLREMAAPHATRGGSTRSPRQLGHRRLRRAEYAEIVSMAECRNLAQLTEFVHDLL